MNYQDYQPLAMRTAKIMDTNREMLIHGAMGCCTEPGEFALTAANADKHFDSANAIEELGDAFWFAAYIANAMGWTLNSIASSLPMKVTVDEPLSKSALLFCFNGSEIGSLIKAHAFYGKTLDHEQLRHKVWMYLQSATQLCVVLGFDVEEVLLANIAKLTKRYPDKYSDAAAIDRADKAVVL